MKPADVTFVWFPMLDNNNTCMIVLVCADNVSIFFACMLDKYVFRKNNTFCVSHTGENVINFEEMIEG